MNRISEVKDFFDPKAINSSFTLAYDYTFLCAIPPEMRVSWASRYSSLIEKDGYLVTLQFPLGQLSLAHSLSPSK